MGAGWVLWVQDWCWVQGGFGVQDRCCVQSSLGVQGSFGAQTGAAFRAVFGVMCQVPCVEHRPGIGGAAPSAGAPEHCTALSPCPRRRFPCNNSILLPCAASFFIPETLWDVPQAGGTSRLTFLPPWTANNPMKNLLWKRFPGI